MLLLSVQNYGTHRFTDASITTHRHMPLTDQNLVVLGVRRVSTLAGHVHFPSGYSVRLFKSIYIFRCVTNSNSL